MSGMSTSDEALLNRYFKLGGGSVVRLQSMLNAMRSLDAMGVEGDVVECGVWNGASMLVAKAVHNGSRKFWMFDTFEGMPPPGPEDKKSDGDTAIDRYKKRQQTNSRWCYAPLDRVRDNFHRDGLLHNTIFVVGLVEETLRRPVLPEQIALLRLDTDWYSSTKIELEILWPRVVPGGILIIDDYGHWLGAKQAVDEYFGRSVDLIQIDYSARMVIK